MSIASLIPLVGIHFEQVPVNAHVIKSNSRLTQNRHNRPIGAHFHSGGVEFSYFGQDFDEAFG
jgi:hypothetical protein